MTPHESPPPAGNVGAGFKPALGGLALCFALAICFALVACKGKEGGAPGAPAGGGGGKNGGKPAARKFPVEVETVTARPLDLTISAVGSLEPSEVVTISSRVAGVAEKVSFREGDVATPERVLVEIEPERFRLARAQAQANLERTQAAAREAEAALAKRTELRKKDPGWVSAEELGGFESRLGVARAEVAQAKAAVDLAELNLRDSFVRAGTTGVIQTRTVQPGQYLTSGTPLAEVVKTDPLFLRFKVPERESIRLTKGMPVRFFIRAQREKEYAARLVYVGEAADPKSRMVDALARVESSPSGGSGDSGKSRLRPGFFAEVTISAGSTRAVPVIPEGAIRPTEKGFVVYVVVDGKAVEKVVDTGLRSADGFVEIRSGLSAGETLVTRGAQYLRPGVSVEIKAALENR